MLKQLITSSVIYKVLRFMILNKGSYYTTNYLAKELRCDTAGVYRALVLLKNCKLVIKEQADKYRKVLWTLDTRNNNIEHYEALINADIKYED